MGAAADAAACNGAPPFKTTLVLDVEVELPNSIEFPRALVAFAAVADMEVDCCSTPPKRRPPVCPLPKIRFILTRGTALFTALYPADSSSKVRAWFSIALSFAAFPPNNARSPLSSFENN